MELSSVIRGLRIKKKLTQQELSERIGVSVVTVRCWEAGSKNPSLNGLVELASVFNVSIDSMLGLSGGQPIMVDIQSNRERKLLANYRLIDSYGKDAVDAVCSAERARMDATLSKHKSTHSERYVPHFITPAAAGKPYPLEDEVIEMIRVPQTGIESKADFAVSISGDSMIPYINDGEIVFVQHTAELQNGEIGIFEVDGETYCKHFYMSESHDITLVSANQKRQDTNVHLAADCERNFRCFGRVLLEIRPTLPAYFLSSLSLSSE